MKCQWDKLLGILPQHLRREVDEQGKAHMDELRLRLGEPAAMICGFKSRFLSGRVTKEDISFVVNTASRYSPWAASTISMGYLTAPGGHRIGLCGTCVTENGKVSGIRDVTSVCIRVARCFPGIGEAAPKTGSLLILGPPGAGKTTLLRDLIRSRSDAGCMVTVVDERGELFPSGAFPAGANTDVLTGCGKPEGILMALRTMGPQCIGVDEITSETDCDGLMAAGWCGVELLATAHASSTDDLKARALYRPLVDSGLFEWALVLERDRTWSVRRLRSCT